MKSENNLKYDEKGRWIYWELWSDKPITSQEAMQTQNPRFMIAGYGFENFKMREVSRGKYVATWQCYSSAD